MQPGGKVFGARGRENANIRQRLISWGRLSFLTRLCPPPRSEETLKVYFSQFGALEGAEVMKDRYTGKSRGFGFVTFTDAGSATRALGVEHTIDGRRCEAKIALPKVSRRQVVRGAARVRTHGRSVGCDTEALCLRGSREPRSPPIVWFTC